MAPEPAEPAEAAEAARCNNHFTDKPILGAKLNLLSLRLNKARLFTWAELALLINKALSDPKRHNVTYWYGYCGYPISEIKGLSKLKAAGISV